MSIPERILTFMMGFPDVRLITPYQFNPVQALTTAPSYTVPTCHLSQWACFSRVLPETYGASLEIGFIDVHSKALHQAN